MTVIALRLDFNKLLFQFSVSALASIFFNQDEMFFT